MNCEMNARGPKWAKKSAKEANRTGTEKIKPIQLEDGQLWQLSSQPLTQMGSKHLPSQLVLQTSVQMLC